MKTKNTIAIWGATAGFIVSLAASLPSPAADTSGNVSHHQRFGRIDHANQIIGSDIKNRQNQSLGKIEDVAVDLESGHILYAIASVDGADVAIPPQSLSLGGGARSFILDADKQKLSGAPRVNKDQLNNVNNAKDIYRYWNQQSWWEGAAQATGGNSFGNVHKLSELKGMQVKNVQNQDLGKVDQVALDFSAGRVAFVLLDPGGILDRQGDFVYALPPNALTAGDNNTLVTDIADKSKLANAPKLHRNNWQELSNPSFASQVYQFYGKQAYFGAGTAPDLNSQNERSKDSNWRERRDQIGHGTTGAGTAIGASVAGTGTGSFGRVEPARTLIGHEIRGAQNDRLGKLDDLVVDLESGRILFGVASLNGNRVAIPAELFSQSAQNQPLMLQVDKQKLLGAPRFTTDIEGKLANADFANEVYRYFGQAPWWEGASSPTGRNSFGNVHKISELNGMQVQSSDNQNLGKLDNVIVDLANSRVPFVILASGGSFGAAQFLYPLPPNALTAGSDQKMLNTGLDREKLQGAPRINRNNLQQLSDQAFAASVYQYYGKQPYWNTASPTGR